MSDNNLNNLCQALRTSDAIGIRKAIAGVGSRVDELDAEQIPRVVEMMASLFYIDLGDKPDFTQVVEDAVSVIASIGESAVEPLMKMLGDSDYKANLMLGRTLGRIGPPAYGPLKDLFYHPPTPWHRAISMFALAKMHEAALMEILPDTVTALDDSDREIRDTAARTIGRIIESFKPGQLPTDLVSHAFERLLFRLKDPSGVVRSKSVRSIGKMIKNQYLSHEQLVTAHESLKELLGIDECQADGFYLVRREAMEALVYLEDRL